MSNNKFYQEDESYECFICHQSLRWSSLLNTIVEVDKDDPQQILNEEHSCDGVMRTKKQEAGLDCMKNEIKLQHELYGKFESSAQFGKDRNEQIKQKQYQKRGPLTEDHRKNIADSMRTTLQSKKELSFLAQNSNQKELEKKEIER